MPFDPLQLPAPQGYGYMGDGTRAPFSAQFAYSMGEVPQFQPPMQPDQVSRELGIQPDRVPDVMAVSQGRKDKQIVGELLNIVAGEPSQLRAITPALAAQFLEHWGYPTSRDAWTYDEWAAALTPAPAVGY